MVWLIEGGGMGWGEEDGMITGGGKGYVVLDYGVGRRWRCGEVGWRGGVAVIGR